MRPNRHFVMGVLFTILLMIFNSGMAKERASIEGRVINAETGEPIPGANIMIAGTYLGAAADLNGHFVLANLNPGTYYIVCSAIGFDKAKERLKLVAGKTSEITFHLKETAIPMNAFVVTASKYKQAIEDVPVRIDLLRPQDIAIRNAVTLDRALQYVPGVQMAGNNISIRGSTGFSSGLGTRTLVLLDGVPFLSGDEGSANFNVIPVSEIQQVEVMKGAGSALYGSSAMGGVINIITRKPDPDTSHVQASAYSGFYSDPSYPQWKWSDKHRLFRGGSLNYMTNFSGVASTLSVNYQKDDNFKEHADYKNVNFYGKFRFDLSANNHWLVQTGWLDRESGGFYFWKDLNHPFIPGNEPVDSFTRTFSRTFYLQSQMTQTLSSRFFYRLRLNYHRSAARDEAFARPGHTPAIVGTYRQSTAQTFGHEMQFGYQINARHNVFFGWDISQNRVSSIQYGRRQDFVGSLYLQYTFRLRDNLKMDLGGRWDAEYARPAASVSRFNPKFGLNYQLRKGSIWRFSAGRGFRVPTIAERFISTFANQIKVEPNPDLKPEQNLSLETGFRQNMGPFSRLDVSYFFNDYWDLIEPQLQSDELAVRFENMTRARIQGLEASQNFSFLKKSLQLNFSYTYIHSQDLSQFIHGMPNPDYKNDLKYRPRHLFYLRAFLQKDAWTTGVDFRYFSKIKRVDRLTNIPDIDKHVPVYVTDVQIGFRTPHASLMFIVNNVFQYYYVISPGNMGDLRNYTVQFSWNYR